MIIKKIGYYVFSHRMKQNTSKQTQDPFFAASIDAHIYEIDLHDTTFVQEALDILERELFYCYKDRHPYCRVIHGIGTGTLMKAVHEAITKNPLVTAWQQEGGSTLVSFIENK